MIQIIPAILSTKESDFERDIERYNNSELLWGGWVHIDFMDNLFVPNKSIEPEIVSKYPIKLYKEAHLMVLHPLGWIEKLAEAGFKRVLFHLEAADDINECIESINSKGMEVGLALNIETPVEKLNPFADKIDKVLLMSITPGFQGNSFKREVLEKIKETSHLRSKNEDLKIGVDGSVKDENAKLLVDAGADFLIVGSFLLKGDINANLEKIWEKVSS
ncbi:ribulose-phosphate 3-epimerase [Candidatus Daviesbacteria bacterium]|nr:ribulose-phosphate 3-epimerase [Candidatus Daviesbacteria bacterium]